MVIDATHPYADKVTLNIREAIEGLPEEQQPKYCRVLRKRTESDDTVSTAYGKGNESVSGAAYVKNMDAYKKLVEINELIKVELKDLILEFNKTKELYEKETNKYSKNYLELSNKLSELRVRIESNDLVKKYHEYEKQINDYLESLRKEMLKTVRGEK